MEKVVITVVGKDAKGILAKSCTYLADNAINILDLKQTIVQDYFTMMLIADFADAVKPFDQIASEIAAVGESIGVQIRCQREEIFEKMHRV
ncbi:MAG: ACT domain-containing protein [Kiritimatiellae bacterium]|nr:ACT domain-containing protein [Kiritimatiellia bacterium]